MNHDITGWFQDSGFYVGLGIKLIAYTLFLKKWFNRNVGLCLLLSAARTVAGAAIGILIYSSLAAPKSTFLFYLGVNTVRLIEWSVVFKIANQDKSESILIFAVSATLLSIMLDLLVIYGWYSTSGGL